MNKETEMVEVTMDHFLVKAIDDKVIERAMNEIMMMNVELTMKIVEFGTVEICELMRNEEIVEKANYEEIAMNAMNENIEIKVDECGATRTIKSENFEMKTMNE